MTTALYIFISFVVLNVVGLLFDLVLRLSGATTITQWVRKYPLLGIPILLIQVLAAIALGFHFWG